MVSKQSILIAAITITLCNSAISVLASDYAEVGLNEHNYYRSLHNSPLMSLSSSLGQAAQDCAVYYASHKAIDHSCSSDGAGENLYATWGNSLDSADLVHAAVEAWYRENSQYNFDNPGASDSDATGHFTQMVWKSSTELGIGVAAVDGYAVVVGKYGPYGNIQDGEWSYYRINVEQRS